MLIGNLILLAILAAIFGPLFLESVWFRFPLQRLLALENEPGGATLAVQKAKALVQHRMATVGAIKLVGLLVLYFGTRLLEHMSETTDSFFAAELNIFPFFVFFIGELLSQFLGYRHSFGAGLRTAAPLYYVLRIFSPLLWILEAMYQLVGGEKIAVVSEKDVRTAVFAAKADGTLTPEEAELHIRELHAGNYEIRDLMVPLENCPRVQVQTTTRSIEDAFRGPRIGSLIVVLDGQSVSGVMEVQDIFLLCSAHRKKGLSEEATVNLTGELTATVDLRGSTLLADALPAIWKNTACVVTDEKGYDIGIITWKLVAAALISKEFKEAPKS